MLSRCGNADDKDYRNYGARGITVDPVWHEFSVFRTWALSHGYAEHLTLDRIDNDGPYGPENCRWASYTVQNRNSRHTVLIEALGERKSIAAWAEDSRCRVSYQTLYQRLVRLQWAPGEAITTPERRN